MLFSMTAAGAVNNSQLSFLTQTKKFVADKPEIFVLLQARFVL